MYYIFDKEIFLLTAEHCLPVFKEEAFLKADWRLRKDKSFMMEALAS